MPAWEAGNAGITITMRSLVVMTVNAGPDAIIDMGHNTSLAAYVFSIDPMLTPAYQPTFTNIIFKNAPLQSVAISMGASGAPFMHGWWQCVLLTWLCRRRFGWMRL